jgi:hypothetical protein
VEDNLAVAKLFSDLLAVDGMPSGIDCGEITHGEVVTMRERLWGALKHYRDIRLERLVMKWY